MEYQRIAAACFVPRLVRWLVVFRDGCCLEWCGCGVGGLVFGTLLGPEATGPGGCAAAFGLWCVLSGLFVSGFLAASIMRVDPFGGCVWGVWFGVVV